MKIMIYCGESWEVWSPKSESKGIGGSEEAVINMARELVKLGHTVTVYNRCGDQAGEYEGVWYKDYLDYEDEKADIMIGWRSTQPWKIVKPKNYKLGYHWLHDTSGQEVIMQALALGARKIIVLSRYHRRYYPVLRNDITFITRNGITLSHFDQDVRRVPHRMFWSSSYDRGLREVLEEWPKIKLAVPDATLHIAYGWNIMEEAAKRNGGEHLKAFKRVKEAMEAQMNQEGIKHLGRVNHLRVAKEFLEADVWGYPTWWPEISCISAMKAQAGGAIPVVIPTGAVAETVQWGVKTDRGYYMDMEGNPAVRPQGMLEQWTEQTIATLLKSEEEKAPYREEMMKWSKEHFDWASLAKEWEGEFSHALRHRPQLEATFTGK